MSYRVIFSQVMRDRVRQAGQEEASHGRLAAFLDLVKKLIADLEADPYAVGDPSYRLKGLGLDMRHVVRKPLVVHFAVDPVHRLVFIKTIRIMTPP
jgi:hypothetical protein